MMAAIFGSSGFQAAEEDAAGGVAVEAVDELAPSRRTDSFPVERETLFVQRETLFVEQKGLPVSKHCTTVQRKAFPAQPETLLVQQKGFSVSKCCTTARQKGSPVSKCCIISGGESALVQHEGVPS